MNCNNLLLITYYLEKLRDIVREQERTIIHYQRMLLDFQAALAYENQLRCQQAAIHPSLLFGKRFQ